MKVRTVVRFFVSPPPAVRPVGDVLSTHCVYAESVFLKAFFPGVFLKAFLLWEFQNRFFSELNFETVFSSVALDCSIGLIFVKAKHRKMIRNCLIGLIWPGDSRFSGVRRASAALQIDLQDSERSSIFVLSPRRRVALLIYLGLPAHTCVRGVFFDLAANVEANGRLVVASEKCGETGCKCPNPGECGCSSVNVAANLRNFTNVRGCESLRMWARSYEFGCEFGQLCKFGCECRRGDKSLRMSANARNVANVATNVGKRCQPYECRKFCKYLRQKKRLRMRADVWRRFCLSVCLRA